MGSAGPGQVCPCDGVGRLRCEKGASALGGREIRAWGCLSFTHLGEIPALPKETEAGRGFALDEPPLGTSLNQRLGKNRDGMKKLVNPG